jgi:hypothetical protein
MKTPEWYAKDLRRHREEMKRTSIGMMKYLKRMEEKDKESDKYIEEANKRLLAQVAKRKAAHAAESLKNAMHIQALKANPQEALVKEPKTLKRKKHLEELQMLNKEVENSKITDIKLDSRIQGMIIKLDVFTKSDLEELKKI